MAERRVHYRFPSYEDRQKAKDQLYSQCGGYAAYEDGYEYETLYLLSSISDLESGMQICVANGGKRIDL